MTVAVPIAAGTQFRTTKGADNVDTEGVYICTPSGIAIPATAANGLLVDVSRLAGQQALDTPVAATVAPVVGGARAYTGGVAPAVDTDNDAAALVSNRTGELSVVEGRWGVTLQASPVLTSGYASNEQIGPKFAMGGAARAAGRGGRIITATAIYRQISAVAIRLHLFEKDPGTISSDSATFAVPAAQAEVNGHIGSIDFASANWGPSSTNYQFQMISGLNIRYTIPLGVTAGSSGFPLWCVAQLLSGTFTPVGSADLTFYLRGEMD